MFTHKQIGHTTGQSAPHALMAQHGVRLYVPQPFATQNRSGPSAGLLARR